MENDKHAYLIIASGQFTLLKKLISCLDYVNNDIYLHIDKKCKIDRSEFEDICKYSKLKLIKPMKVAWGGTSLTNVSLNLLEEASKNHYGYYHLISGQDLPLKNQIEIHNFFNKTNKNFISVSEMPEWAYKRIDHFYPFQNITKRKNIFNATWRNIIIPVFDKMHFKRTRKYPVYGLGSQWFSIKDDFAQCVRDTK